MLTAVAVIAAAVFGCFVVLLLAVSLWRDIQNENRRIAAADAIGAQIKLQRKALSDAIHSQNLAAIADARRRLFRLHRAYRDLTGSAYP